MGSFYATCSVSGMSITHQKTYVILLVPSAYCFKSNDIDRWESEELKALLKGEKFNKPKPKRNISEISYDSRNAFKEKGLMVSNEGSQIMFSPFGFPIKGEYYDYGYIENIEKNRSVELLEEFFNMSIEEILNCASDEREVESFLVREDISEEAKEILQVLTMTYIRSEIYDFLISNKDFHENTYWWKYNIKEKEESIENLFKSFENKIEEDSFRFNNRYSIIPSLCEYNYMKFLKLKFEDISLYKEQHKFISALGTMYKSLLPSNYGSQSINFKNLISLYEKSIEVMKQDSQYFDNE